MTIGRTNQKGSSEKLLTSAPSPKANVQMKSYKMTVMIVTMRLTLQNFYTTELGLQVLPGLYSYTSTVLKLCINFKHLSLYNKPS
jgi:hypothetical protein